MSEQKSFQLNLEYQSRLKILSILLIATLSFIICAIVASTISPPVTGESSLIYSSCTKSQPPCFSNSSTNYIDISVSLHKYNQIFYLVADFLSGNEISTTLNYSLLITSPINGTQEVITSSNNTFQISCAGGACASSIVFYIPFIEYTNYNVIIATDGVIPVDSVKYSIKFITKDFTQFFLGTKYFFLAICILVFAWFKINLYRVGRRFWSRESLLVGGLGVSLFLFNEPFLAMTLQKQSIGWSTMSVFCNAQFVAMLLLFWFIVLHNEFNKKKFITALSIEIMLIVIFFALLMVLYMYTTVQIKYNPAFDWKKDLSSAAKGVFIGVIILIVAFGIWLVCLVGFSVSKFRKVGLRQKFLKGSVVLMMILTFALVGVGAFQPLPRSGTLLLITVSLYNFYIYVLAWMCAPAIESLQAMITEQKKEAKGEDPNNSTFLQLNGVLGKENQV